MLIFRLAGLYGRAPGYEMPHLTETDLERKRDHCEAALSVLDAVEPGISVAKGTLLYELHLPHLMLSQIRLRAGAISAADSAKEFEMGRH